MPITGHHHISMYTKDARQNKYFYTEILGLRLVEKTVNQDNPTMYHLFYGDQTGTPGTLLTFFEMPNLGKHHPGTNSIARLALLVPDKQALDFFEARLNRYEIQTTTSTYLGQQALAFQDPDGLELILIDNHDRKIPEVWQHNPYSDIPENLQILGMGPVELRLRDIRPTADFLIDILGYQPLSADVYSLDSKGLYSDFVLVEDNGERVKPGRGYVHHIAVSVPTDEDLEAIRQKIDQLSGSNSGIIDRYFFKSLYYRHNKIMYEFATEAPGFIIDTPIENLGETLTLPDFLEDRRAEIENNLEEI